jgi:hypothetical protein
MYDPDVTGTGHQPRGFDQLMLFYDHYVVTNARLVASFYNASTAVSSTAFVTVRDNSVPSSNHLDYMESSLTKYVQLGVEQASTANQKIAYEVNIGRFLGRRDPMSDPDLKGSTSTNPPEGCSFHIGAFTPDLFTSSNVLLSVVLEYTVNLIEPKIVVAS